MQILKKTNINFVRWRWHALALSWVVIMAGLVTIWRVGMPLGVEFSGGSIVIVKFDQTPDLTQIRSALERSLPGVGTSAQVQRYGDATANQVMVRVPWWVKSRAGTSARRLTPWRRR
jgi:preprotein translocase subunit SecF